MKKPRNKLHMECLEPRLMLAADIVLFRLQPVGLDGSPIDQVSVGDSFDVEVSVQDIRDDPKGVFSSYLDVEYDPALVKLEGELEFGDIYAHGKEGDTSVPGLIDEAGAFSGQLRPVGPGEIVVFTARFTAVAAGNVVFSGNPADDTPALDVGVYGNDLPVSDDETAFEDGPIFIVPGSQIAFAFAPMTVIASAEVIPEDPVDTPSRFQNPSNRFDTNDDGVIAPLDALLGINQLNEKGPRKLTDDDMLVGSARRYLDVNGDGTHAPGDVLAIVNQLNSVSRSDGEGESSPTDTGVFAGALQPLIASQTIQIDIEARPAFDRPSDESLATQRESHSAARDHNGVTYNPTQRSIERSPISDPEALPLEDVLDEIATGIAPSWWK